MSKTMRMVWKTSRPGVCCGHCVRPQGWPTILMGQDLGRSVPSRHWSRSQCFPCYGVNHPNQTARYFTGLRTTVALVKTYGPRNFPLRFASKQYRRDFIVSEVSRPLLGADFLQANSLLVDVEGKRLVYTETYFSSPLCKAKALAPRPQCYNSATK